MYYLIYIAFYPSASLYDDNVISFRESSESFDTIEEAQEYIKWNLVMEIKVESSEGEVDPEEIEVYYHEKEEKNKATLDAFYLGDFLLRYECWIMESRI